MLRGQASLQEMIGRSFMNRKRPGSKNKKKAEAAEVPAKTEQIPALELEPSAAGTPRSASLQPGQVLCPVCGLPVLERAMNSHLGKAEQNLVQQHCIWCCKAAFAVCRQLPGTGDLAA